MRLRILPYKKGSASAKALAEKLGAKRIKLTNSRFTPRSGDVIINWGNSKMPANWDGYTAEVFNQPDLVKEQSDKLRFFTINNALEWLPTFWTSAEEIPDEAFPVVCRTVLNGHSGNGIVIADSRDDLAPAKLYVKYIKKKDEYRIHLGRNADLDIEVIDIQQKKRNTSCDQPNWQIRNHQNGFIYAREGVVPPDRVLECALDCFSRSWLDFGAVDVIWSEWKGEAYVLEINTAPGLQGTTLDKYGEFFRSSRGLRA
jgi:hypothetical protein